MSNELTIFEGQELEILTKGDVNFKFKGTALFNGNQISKMLGYSEKSRPINNHVRDNQKYLVKNSDVLSNNFRKLNNTGETFITEYGLCCLIQMSPNTSQKKEELLKQFFPDKDIIVVNSRKEIEFLDALEETFEPFGYYCTKQHDILNYKIDMFINDLNIAIEYDENNHSHYTYDQQKRRQLEIEKEIGCKFIRISDKESDNYNIGLVMKEISEFGLLHSIV